MTLSIRRDLDRFDAHSPLSAARTPPGTWYVRPEFFELERSAVFRNTWQFVGRTDQVQKSGCYFAGEIAGAQYLVVRDQEGTLRAFHNACRHKATRLVQGEGCADQLVCGYHGWTYGLDGCLRKAPLMGERQDFSTSRYGLSPIAVQSLGPWIFLHLGTPARDLVEEYPGLEACYRDRRLDSMAYVARRVWTLRCNWKVFIDNYLDGGYHIDHLHKALAVELDLERYRTVVHPRWSLQICPAAERSSERVGADALYAWAYPNFMVNRYGCFLDTNRVIPVAVDETRVEFDYYLEPEALPRKEQILEQSLAISDRIQREDIDISAEVHRGLQGGSFEGGPYGAPETSARQFHQLLAADLRGALPPVEP